MDYTKITDGDYGGSVILEGVNMSSVSLMVSIFVEIFTTIVTQLVNDKELQKGDKISFRIKVSKPWLN